MLLLLDLSIFRRGTWMLKIIRNTGVYYKIEKTRKSLLRNVMRNGANV
jgi:hypothetical protein